MEEVLAIKPDIVFLWDEAWYAYNRFSPFHRMRSAMGACEALRERYASEEYRAEYAAFKRSTARSIRRIRRCSTRISCLILMR
jgi:hypothetical protein